MSIHAASPPLLSIAPESVQGRSTDALEDRKPPEKTLPRESELIK
jgi:hypothetical protein